MTIAPLYIVTVCNFSKGDTEQTSVLSVFSKAIRSFNSKQFQVIEHSNLEKLMFESSMQEFVLIIVVRVGIR